MFMLRLVTALLLALALPAAANGQVPARPHDPKPWDGPFPACAILPARIELDPRLDLLPSGMTFLGDPVAYGIGLAISSHANARAERTAGTIHWPRDSAAFAAQLREALVAGLDGAAFGTLQLEGEPPADCPWLLRARSRAIFSRELDAIHLITMLHIEPRDAPGAPAYASHLTLAVALPAIAGLRSKGEREAAWATIDEARIGLLVADGYRVAARILSDDALARGAAPDLGSTRRFMLASGGVQRGKLVKRFAGHYVLRSRVAHLVAQPDWMKEP